MFSVVTPATADQKLISTVAAVKLELGITDSSQDALIRAKLEQITAQVVSFIRVPQAQDGSATLARETLEQKFRFGQRNQGCRTQLILARIPATSVDEVIEDGVTLDEGDYEVDGAAGLLTRLRGDCESTWGRVITVTYQAGWKMPSDGASATLPMDIQSAAVTLVKQAYLTKDRDFTIKSEWTTDVEKLEYASFVASSSMNRDGVSSPFPPDITNTLLRYQYRYVDGI